MQSTTAASPGARPSRSNSSPYSPDTVAMQSAVTRTRVLQSSTPDTRHRHTHPTPPRTGVAPTVPHSQAHRQDFMCGKCARPASTRCTYHSMCSAVSGFTPPPDTTTSRPLTGQQPAVLPHLHDTQQGPTASSWPAGNRCCAQKARGQQQHRRPPTPRPAARNTGDARKLMASPQPRPHLPLTAPTTASPLSCRSTGCHPLCTQGTHPTMDPRPSLAAFILQQCPI